MKLLTFLFFAGMMQIHAAVYSQNTFNLKETSATVKEILKKIERESNYTFFYRHDQLNLNQKVKVIAENSPIDVVMRQVLADQPLTFEVVDQMVVIKPLTETVKGRDYTIAGVITDEKAEPLPGASIRIKGTNIGATTDVEGRFTLKVPGEESVTLSVSYLGFKTQEIVVRPNQGPLTIRLVADASALEEVVVVGYGTVKKRDLTGAVTSVKSEDIMRSPTHNPVEALQARVPGADITRSSGAPGAASNITIRGTKSIAARDKLAERNSPLYIIDGFQGGDISTLNAADIESIEVLKDASSTAIYGAQGANGVIIVTTKKGTAGKTKVSYNAYYGINKYSFPASRSGEDYLNLRREAWRNPASGTAQWTSPADDPKLFTNLPGELAAYQAGQWVDWVDLVAEDGSQQSHNISVNGGSDKTKFLISAGYFREEGMLRNSNYDRYNLRANLDHSIGKYVKAGILSQVTYNNVNNRRDPLSVALSLAPFGVPFDENGIVNRNPIGSGDTRVSPLLDERSENVARDNNIRTNVMTGGYAEIKPLPGLTFRTNFNVTLNFNRRGIYNDRSSLAQVNNQISFASSATGFNRFLNWDNILTYTKDIADHSITATAITSYLQSDADDLSASGSGQILASQLYYNLGATNSSLTRSIGSPYVGWQNMAYAARLNYSFKGKYTLYLSGRYDGASRLAPGNKWDFFPSGGIGWNVIQENFIKDIEQISNLKLRATYGVSGNYVIDPYGTQSGLTYSSRMGFGNVPADAYLFNPSVGNPDLGWEKSATANLGLDFGFFNNRLSGSIDVYETKTSDILYPRTLPQSSGVASVFQNIAATQNRGVEVSLSSQNINSKLFRWTSTLTFSRNREKITALINGKDIISDERNSLLIGRPINSFYTFNKLGIWQTEEAEEAMKYRYNSATGNAFKPGDIKLADLNGDFIIDATNDRSFVGSTVPDWIGGLQNNFYYKGFDLGVFLFARYGQTIDAQFLGRYNPGGLGNGPAMINYWTPENPTNDFPRPRQNEANLTNYPGYQSLNFVDGSFFKIKNLTLGYTLPKTVSERIKSDNIRIYLTGSNLLTVAKSHLIKNYDPERGGAESGPLARQFVFGVNLGF